MTSDRKNANRKIRNDFRIKNAPRLRGKGELPDCIHAVPWAEARKCNSPVSFIVDNWEFQEFLKKLLTIIKIYGIIEK